MSMYYVSHPFTGDEKKNRKEARRITAALKKKHPQHIFINPLDAMRYTEGLPYEESLRQCIELLSVCDGIFMTGHWEQSSGCIRELIAAAYYRKIIKILKGGAHGD